MGHGRLTRGARAGKNIKLYKVTNLNSDGPGSFKDAISQPNRIIVFGVAGVLDLNRETYRLKDNQTILFETAPGDGIELYNGRVSSSNASEVIVRYMRVRMGRQYNKRDAGDAGGLSSGFNQVYDHCSFTWGLDENISFYRHMFNMGDGKPSRKEPTVNVTIQNTISAKGLDTYNHAFGSTIGGENTSFMRNLWADNTGRNPSIGWGGVFNFVNNVIYNWVHRTADGGEFSTMSNFINNYYKPGPLTPKDPERLARGLPHRQVGEPQPEAVPLRPVRPRVRAGQHHGGQRARD